jgi:hypothetical protein
MKLSDKATIPQQVMAREVGDEIAILNLESGTYYGLDPVGARIWQLMTEGTSFAGICDVMVGEFDVSKEVLEKDVLRLAGELYEKGLIKLA